jgi:DNA-binding response OmpR family regulator
MVFVGESPAPRRLLVVEDEPDLRLLYADELAEAGYEIKTAGSCAEASELLRNFDFDLLILDIQLHRESGLQILQQVAQERPGLPVILCTAYSCYRDDFTAWRADACIIKSADFSVLKNEVRRQLARRGRTGRGAGFRPPADQQDLERRRS